MTRIIAKENPRGHISYRDEERKMEFGRIIGGLGWPGEQPGFAVVLGEEYNWRPPHHVHLLTEYEDADLSRLLQRCVELVSEYVISDFVGRHAEEQIEYLRLWNARAREQKMSTFILSRPPFEDGGLSYHLQIVKDRLAASQKSLFLSKDSKLPGYLLELSSDQALKATDFQHPAIAALAYAVTTLTIRPADYLEEASVGSYVERSEFLERILK